MKRDTQSARDFTASLSSALRPAPELRIISEHILSKIRAHASAMSGGGGSSSRARGRRRQSSDGAATDFNCLHVRPADLLSVDA